MPNVRELLDQIDQYQKNFPDYKIPNITSVDPYSETIRARPQYGTSNTIESYSLPKWYAGERLTPTAAFNAIPNAIIQGAKSTNPAYGKLQDLITGFSTGTPLTFTDDTGSIKLDPFGNFNVKAGNTEFNVNVPNKSVGVNFNTRF
jgi:hypothetical protein